MGDSHSKKERFFSVSLDRIGEALGEVGGLALAGMVAIVTINVLTRALANQPIPGFYEIVGLLGAGFYAFGIVYAAIKGQHIVMSMLDQRILPQSRGNRQGHRW